MQESFEIVEKLRHSWRKTWNFNFRGWNFFEAVVYDEAGESYLISAGAMGNKYLAISTAWIVSRGNWYFLNKNFTAHVLPFRTNSDSELRVRSQLVTKVILSKSSFTMLRWPQDKS